MRQLNGRGTEQRAFEPQAGAQCRAIHQQHRRIGPDQFQLKVRGGNRAGRQTDLDRRSQADLEGPVGQEYRVCGGCRTIGQIEAREQPGGIERTAGHRETQQPGLEVEVRGITQRRPYQSGLPTVVAARDPEFEVGGEPRSRQPAVV
ncbi:hypothetical protein D3C75_746250 [compost metagenome]